MQWLPAANFDTPSTADGFTSYKRLVSLVAALVFSEWQRQRVTGFQEVRACRARV